MAASATAARSPAERGPMKLTRSSRQALAGLVYLARQPPGAWYTAQEVAQAEGLPETFLMKLLGQLVKAGVARQVKGPGGGYSLARPAKEITLLEVVEAVDGPIRGESAGVGAGEATMLAKRLQAVCDGAAELLREWLAEVTLAALARGK
jgi:Rrf2 family protein